jgi:hypothetical protein
MPINSYDGEGTFRRRGNRPATSERPAWQIEHSTEEVSCEPPGVDPVRARAAGSAPSPGAFSSVVRRLMARIAPKTTDALFERYRDAADVY